MNLVYDIPMGNSDNFNVVVEIPKSSHYKYEYDPGLESFKLDRILLPSMVYPGNYGFIPQTVADDGDALDVLIVNTGTIERGTIVDCYALGALDIYNDGKRDIKIIAMPNFHYMKYKYSSLSDFYQHFTDHIHHFFSHYKDLEDKKVEIKGWLTANEARENITVSNNAFVDYAKKIQDTVLKLYKEYDDNVASKMKDSSLSEGHDKPKLKIPPLSDIDVKFKLDDTFDIGLN